MGSFSGLLNNSILLLALCVIYDSFGIHNISNKKLQESITGVLVALITVAVMVNPWVLKPGVFFDTRGVILGLSGLFFGLFPTSIAVIIAALLRIFQGGSGALPGTLVVISTASVGLIWRYWKKENITALNWKQMYVFGFVVHLVFISCLVTLPATIRFHIIMTVAPPILAIFPFITLFGGIILLKQEIRRKTEHELIESRKMLTKERGLLKGVIDTIPDLIYFKDNEGRYLGANKAFQTFVEKEEKEIQGKLLEDFFEGDIAAYSLKKDLETIADDKIIGYESYLKTKNGKSALFDILKAPFKGIDGTLYGLVAISRDITERKRGEIERKKLKAQLSNAIEMANLGHWEYDVINDLFLFNDYFYKIFRTTVEKVGGYTMTSGEYAERFIHPDDRRLIGKEIRKAIEGTDPNRKYQAEHRVIFPDGETGYISVAFFIVTDTDGKTIKTYGVNQNITERKKMEEELRQAHKLEAVGTLAGGIAHDFNNILGIIVGNIELALEDIPDWNPARANLNEVKKAGLRARNVVQQLLSFSRKSEQQRTPLNLASVIEESIKLLRASIPSNIDIKTDIRDAHTLINADSTQIQQILINLCANAAHAMEENGGVLTLSLTQKKLDGPVEFPNNKLPAGSYMYLVINDTGEGIPPNIMDKVFDPYFTTKVVGKGSGLGLSIVHGIVTNYGGGIRIQSEPEKGTAIEILLPVYHSKYIETGAAKAELPKGNERILFIDDEESIVRVISQMLKRLGYSVDARTHPKDALSAFKSNPYSFDLLITDMTMPELTGDQLAAQIKDVRSDIPIIICTGFSERMDEQKADNSKIAGVLMKPVIRSDMAKMVRKVLDET